MVNEILRDRWIELLDEDKLTWRQWAAWDKKRHARDVAIYEKKEGSQNEDLAASEDERMKEVHVPKKRSAGEGSALAHIPKKKRI